MQLTVSDGSKFDACIEMADEVYRSRMHSLCCDNCHSHVARVLNEYGYRGRDNYTMVSVWWILVTKGKYVTWTDLFLTYSAWILILIIVAAVVTLENF